MVRTRAYRRARFDKVYKLGFFQSAKLKVPKNFFPADLIHFWLHIAGCMRVFCAVYIF